MILRDKKIILVLPPKTGSTSLVKELTRNGITFRNNIKGKIHPYLSDMVAYSGISDLESYDIYQLCRNPLDRMVSSYYFHKQIIKNKSKYKDFLDLDFSPFLKLITDNKHLIREDNDSFCLNVFNDYNFIEKGFRSDRGLRFYVPQNEWNDVGATINYLKLEEVSKDDSILSEILDLDFKFPHKNKSPKRPKTDIEEFYSDTDLELMKKHYEEDFKILNYKLPNDI